MTTTNPDCDLPTRGTPPPDTTTCRGGPMNDKIRAWVDARICQRCWRSRIPFTVDSDGRQNIDCTCGRTATPDEVERRHQQSVADAADTVELHSWRGRLRGKGWLGS